MLAGPWLVSFKNNERTSYIPQESVGIEPQRIHDTLTVLGFTVEDLQAYGPLLMLPRAMLSRETWNSWRDTKRAARARLIRLAEDLKRVTKKEVQWLDWVDTQGPNTSGSDGKRSEPPGISWGSLYSQFLAEAKHALASVDIGVRLALYRRRSKDPFPSGISEDHTQSQSSDYFGN